MNTVPIFQVSNVTGEGMENLRKFLNLYSKNESILQSPSRETIELHIDQLFEVKGVGPVIGGQLVKGTIRVGEKYLVGPNNNSYKTVYVRSIQCKRMNVDEISQGCYVCLGIKKYEGIDIRRGQVLIGLSDRPVQVRDFKAEIIVNKSSSKHTENHSNTIKVGYEPVMHVNSIRQTTRIMHISNKKCARGSDTSDEVLRRGDRAVVDCQFCYKPEYIRVGSRILLSEGKIKIVGKIIEVKEELVKVE
jgi:GTPase